MKKEVNQQTEIDSISIEVHPKDIMFLRKVLNVASQSVGLADKSFQADAILMDNFLEAKLSDAK